MEHNDFVGQLIRINNKGVKKEFLVIIPLVWALVVVILLWLGFNPITSFIGTRFSVATTLFISIPLLLGAVGVTIWGLFRLLAPKKEVFVLHSKNIPTEEARRIINEEARQGRILLEEYFRVSDLKSAPKFILTPSFLLVTDLKLEVIPTNDIAGISSTFENSKYLGQSVNYQISTNEETHTFECYAADIAHAEKLVNTLNSFIFN